MSNNDSMNELDRAIMRMAKSHAALPDFMRCLSEGELWTFIPWHPEVENTVMELKNGMKMPFTMFQDNEGEYVAIYSSFERAREAMKKGRFPARTVSAGSMEAKKLLHVLGSANLRAEVNKGCKTGSLVIGPDMMRDVASGSAFEAEVQQGTTQKTFNILSPADFPTSLLQPIFEVLKQHREFRAAWIFGRSEKEPAPPNGRGYNLMVLMEPRNTAIFHDLNLVSQSAAGERDEIDLGFVPDNDGTYTAKLFALAEPFYVATDYERPAQPPANT